MSNPHPDNPDPLEPGMVFNRWTILKFVGHNKHKQRMYLVRCTCGTEAERMGSALKLGNSKSCGCLRRETTRDLRPNLRHGHAKKDAKSSTWETWRSMRRRCTQPSNKDWRYYGGRGITVCERWESFDNFFADMGERPADRTIDRIDVNGNYEPGNCRWATAVEQESNKRRHLTNAR